MHPQRAFGTEVSVDLHSLFNVHVLVGHEPAWFVGPDGQERDIEAATI
jgi:hypothetical protein